MSAFANDRLAANESVVTVEVASATGLAAASQTQAGITTGTVPLIDSDAVADSDATLAVSVEAAAASAAPPDPERPGSPVKCTVCISPCQNLAKTDVCNHQFCFECIKRWSREKNNCPLCKRVFNEIRYNYKSATKFSVYKVTRPSSRNNINITDLFYDQLEHQRTSRDFRVSSIFGSQNSRHLNEYFMSHPAIEFVDLSIGGVSSSVHSHRIYNRFLSVSTTAFRRSIYYSNLWTVPFRNSVEEVTVHDFLTNESYEIKLRPWLNREVLALMGNDNPLQQMFIGEMNQVLRLENVLSRHVLNLCEVYLRHRSLHFLHELNTFMRSRLDMNSYDCRIQFNNRNETHTELILRVISRNNETRTHHAREEHRTAAAASTLLDLQQSISSLAASRRQQVQQSPVVAPPPPTTATMTFSAASSSAAAAATTTTTTSPSQSNQQQHEQPHFQALNMISPIIESAMTDYMSIFQGTPHVITLNSDESDNESEGSVILLGNNSNQVEVIDLLSDSDAEAEREPIVVPSSSSSSASSASLASSASSPMSPTSSTSWESLDVESLNDDNSRVESETNSEFDRERESEEERERDLEQESGSIRYPRSSEGFRDLAFGIRRRAQDTYLAADMSSRRFRRMRFPIEHQRRCPLWRYPGFDFGTTINLDNGTPLLDYWDYGSSTTQSAIDLDARENTIDAATTVLVSETESSPAQQSLAPSSPETNRLMNTFERMSETLERQRVATHESSGSSNVTDSTTSAAALDTSQIKSEVKVEPEATVASGASRSGRALDARSDAISRRASSKRSRSQSSPEPDAADAVSAAETTISLASTSAALSDSSQATLLSPPAPLLPSSASASSKTTIASDSQRAGCSHTTSSSDEDTVILRKRNSKRHRLN